MSVNNGSNGFHGANGSNGSNANGAVLDRPDTGLISVPGITATAFSLADLAKHFPSVSVPAPILPIVDEVVSTVAPAPAPETILEVLQMAAAEGVPEGSINPRDTGGFLTTAWVTDVSEVESQFLGFIAKGVESVIFDDPNHLEDILNPETGGQTPLSEATEYYSWREARRQFCVKVEEYLAHVYADELRREKAEEGINIVDSLPFDREAGKMFKFTAAGRKRLVSRLSALDAYLNTKKGVYENDAMLDTLMEIPGLKLGQGEESDDAYIGIASMLFEKKQKGISKNEFAIRICNAMQIANVYLQCGDATKSKLLIAAAVATHQMRKEREKQAKKQARKPKVGKSGKSKADKGTVA